MINNQLLITTVRWGHFRPSQPARRVTKVGPNQTVTPGPNQTVTATPLTIRQRVGPEHRSSRDSPDADAGHSLQYDGECEGDEEDRLGAVHDDSDEGTAVSLRWVGEDEGVEQSRP
jgi:hypothetical protein